MTIDANLRAAAEAAALALGGRFVPWGDGAWAYIDSDPEVTEPWRTFPTMLEGAAYVLSEASMLASGDDCTSMVPRSKVASWLHARANEHARAALAEGARPFNAAESAYRGSEVAFCAAALLVGNPWEAHDGR